MKRTFFGLGLLSVITGLGSAGIYYVQPLLTATPSASEEQTPGATAAEDASMTPIPLAADSQGASANPFRRASQPQTVRVEDERWAEPATLERAPANEIPDARDLTLENNSGFRAPSDRYAEQPASAESPDDGDADTTQPVADEPATSAEPATAELETPEPSNEPRRISITASDEDADRYGRPNEPAKNNAKSRVSAVRQAPAKPIERRPIEREPIETKPTSSPDEPAEASPDEAGDGEPGTGRPGDPQLSGSQAPTLTIEKSAPPEIQIGKPAKFTIRVRNAGSVVAHGVEIHDSVPQGTQLIDAQPQANRGQQGELLWDLGSLKPNEEQTIELQLMPMSEGEIGSVATVHFRAEASVRTMATKPMLNLEVLAPSKVNKGEELTLKIKLSNPGSGAATGVVLSEVVPEGLKHSAGPELEFDVGTLKPGESRELELGLTAATAGQVTNVIAARAEANLETEARTELEIVAPQLQVSMTGPKRRYLERNATHNISVTNPGTASAKDIELAAALPKEIKFVEANNGGQYDAATHSVYWSLEELPPQETGTVTLTTLPQQPGEAKFTIKSSAQAGLADQREEFLSIEGLAAINFQLSDVNDPIEAGGQTAYEVRVTNQGSKTATGIRVTATLPAEMKPMSAEGPVRYKIEGQRVVFEPLKQLAPKADTAFTIKVKATEPGDLRIQVQIVTDDIHEPITKEESTRVYGDE